MRSEGLCRELSLYLGVSTYGGELCIRGLSRFYWLHAIEMLWDQNSADL